MNKRLAAALVALAVPALAVPALAVPALAVSAAAAPAPLQPAAAASETRTTRITLHDAAGDVWTAPLGSDSWTEAPDQRVGDVLRARAAHRHRAITLRLVFADLRRAATIDYEFAFRTDQGRSYAQVAADREHPRGVQHLWQQSGDPISCSGLSHRIDYTDETLELRIPRACLDGPAWVRLVTYDQRGTATARYLDNPHNDEALPDGFTPRLFRG